MRKKLLLLLLLLLLTVFSGVTTRPAQAQSEPAVVHAVLFWTNGCPYCAEVITGTLPAIQENYRAQLRLLLVEVVSLEDIEDLYALGTSLGISKEEVSVPLLLVDQTALIGADAIREQLPGLIDAYLVRGGLEYSHVPPLNEMLGRGIPFTSFDGESLLQPQAAADTKAAGNALAWIVMAIMLLALGFSVLAIVRASNGRALATTKPWMNTAILILSIAGLGVSLYLTYVELTHTRAICGPVGDCNAVQSSPYAKLFGLIPIGLAGAAGYVAILFVWLWQRLRNDALARAAGLVLFAMALFGTLFSIYLTYLELFVIHAVCLWCLSSAVIITALMLLSLPPVTQWLALSEEEEQDFA